MSDQQATLSAQQLQALHKQYQDAITALGKRMEVRDRALDQAIKVSVASFGGPPADGKVVLHPMQLAKEMFEFLTADQAAAQAAPQEASRSRGQ